MRIINADALMRRAEKTLYADHPFIRFMRSQVGNAPTIDAVPVVRCKDCKHRIKWNDSFGCAFWGYYGDEFADGEMFCRKGERKDDE